MPAKGRTPSNPPRRRPRVAGQSRRTQAEASGEPTPDEPTPAPTETWAGDPASDPADAEPEPEADLEPALAPAPAPRPQPRPRYSSLRPTPVRRPAEPAPAKHVPQPAAEDTRGRRFAGALTIVLLLLVTVVFGAAAGYFRGQAARAGTGSADNRAVVDTAATSEVVGQVSKAIETVLSYDYTKLDDNERAASQVITGKYQDEFGKTFADVRKTAPEQKLVLTTTVLLAGVTILNGDRAEVIATMDLNAVRDTTPYNSPGRVKVVAAKVDGRWKIAEMTLL